MKLFDQTLSLLERSLDTRLQRHNLLASNLANADTPGFEARDIDFEQAMRTAAAEIAAAAQGAPAGGGSPGPAAPAVASGDGGSGPVAGLGASGGFATGERRLLELAQGPRAPLPTVAGGGAAAGIDQNRVDADRVLVTLAENGLQYGAAARAAGKKLAILRYVASDGNA